MKIFQIIGILSTLFLFAACSKNTENPVKTGNSAGIYHMGNGDEPADIDPHITTGIPEHHIQLAVFEGLVSKHPKTLKPVPGVAESWEISEDLLTYTFNIRKEAKWSDGTPLVAEDFVWSWERALMPALGNQYAYSLYAIENAKKYHLGELDSFDSVGVKALDKHTLQVTLEKPTSYFLQLLDHHSMYPVPKHVILKWGERDERGTQWTRPENFVGNGPFTLDTWVPNKVLTVKKNPLYWEADVVKLNEIHFHPIPQLVTEERMFRSGQLHKTDEMPLEKIATYRKKQDPTYQNQPYYATYFYRLNTTFGPLKDKRVRQALAYSIDRERITRLVTKAGETPSYALTPADPNGYSPTAAQVFDVEKAKALLAEAGYPNGEGLPPIELLYNTSEWHKKLAVTMQQMWKDNLGIEVELLNQDWKVYLNSQRSLSYQMCRASWVGDYVDPTTFLELFTSNSGNNNTGWKNAEYDALLDKASQAKSEKERFEYFNAAEAILLEEAPIIPIYIYARNYLLNPSVKGVEKNIMDYYSFKHISLDDSGKE